LCRIIARMYHTQHAVATPDATSGKRVFLPLSRTVTDAWRRNGRSYEGFWNCIEDQFKATW